MKNGSSHRTSSKVPKTMVLKNAASRPDIIDKQEAIPLEYNKKSLEDIASLTIRLLNDLHPIM
jgi:hypothetical protein